MIPGDDDGTVAVARTQLPQAAESVIFPVGHTTGMNDPAVIKQILQWLSYQHHGK